MIVTPTQQKQDYCPTAYILPKEDSSFLKKVSSVVSFCLKSIVAMTFFLSSPALFCTGFITGVIWKDQMEGVISKITNAWNNSTGDRKFLLFLGCLLAMPITVGFSSTLMGAHIGSKV